MVDLEHAESSGRGPIRERIQVGTRNRILVYTGIAAKQASFGEPAPVHRFGPGTGQHGVPAVEPVVRHQFHGAIAEQARGRVPEKMAGSASTSKSAARAAAAVKAVWLTPGALAEKPVRFMAPRYRFDFEHITKLNPRRGDEHFGSVAVTLESGEPLARAAIVDASGCRACRA
ncbi:hypothetical protein [Amycolatopsis sp. cmx-4-61]|uniref:hypothetical protein n=1 Tax=Amycolatopsis sp. cmx-4-61 TaxID=2790937 RepID=UPI00397A4A1A